MLVLSRKKDEKIIIGDNISIMVVDIRRDKVRLGIEAPRDITVHRKEVYEAIQRKKIEEGQDTSGGNGNGRPSYHQQPLHDPVFSDDYLPFNHSFVQRIKPFNEFYW